MKKILSILLTLSFYLFTQAQEITINQLGYYTNQVKLANVPDNYSGNFNIISDADDAIVFTAPLSEAAIWAPAAQSVRIADFTEFNSPGFYHIELEDGDASSYSFQIGSDIYTSLMRDALRFFYLSRVSMPLEAEYAGEYARPAGHPDTAVIIHESAASAERPAGSTISTPGGWYDAGDYNKYVVNAGISNYTVFAIAEHYPDLAAKLDLNIPESDNGVPDIIDEAVYNLRWMLSMQDPNDGGVYHKCTHLNFTGFVTPANAANTPRYVVMKTTAATLDMAAVAAQASRILADYETEYPGLADSCLNAAILAYSWAQDNPTVYYRQPSNVSTGSYGDGNVTDEFKWAAMELYITTADDSYLDDYDYLAGNASTPGWGSVSSLGLISLVRNADQLTPAVDLDSVKGKIITYADNYYNSYVNSAYKIPNVSFGWGSNSSVANGAMMCLQAYHLTGLEKYRETAVAGMDYLLGRNPTLYSYVTGYGSKTPMHPHDRKSASDGVVEPIPAMLVGGANAGNTDEDCGANQYPSSLDALSYLDEECSYSTNEITINWNAPLAYVACVLQSLQKTGVIKAQTGDTDSTLVYIQFDTELEESSLDASDYSITVNEGDSKSISSVGLSNSHTLEITLTEYISKADSNILFSYIPGTLTSISKTGVDTLENIPVINLVYGSAPVVIKAASDQIEPVIYVHFSKKITDPSANLLDWQLDVNGAGKSFSTASIAGEDSLSIKLELNTFLRYTDTLLLSYTGSTYVAKDSGFLKPFDSLSVKNNYTTPAEMLAISLSPAGNLLEISFNKNLADTSVYTEEFLIQRNKQDTVAISDVILKEGDAKILNISLVDKITESDSNLVLSYIGTRLISIYKVPVDTFGPSPFENRVTLALSIPGVIQAEEYFLNSGYVFETTSDAGGGQNLGYADPGDYADYFVDVATSGEYTIIYRLASNVETSEFILLMPEDQPIDTISISSTGGWQVYDSVYSLVNLEAGEQIMRIYTTSAAMNLNWLSFIEGNVIPEEPESLYQSSFEDFSLYPNPLKKGGDLNIRYKDGEMPTEIAVGVFDLSGRCLGNLIANRASANTYVLKLRDLGFYPESGLYILQLTSGTSKGSMLLRVD